MTAFWQDLRHAARTLARRPGFALVAVLTLALGIGATAAVFGALHAVLLRPLPYPAPDRLVIGRGTHDSGHRGQPVSAHNYHDYREQNRSFESLAAWTPWPVTLVETGGGEPRRVSASWISENFFGTLGVRPALGRAFTLEETKAGGPAVAIISHACWQRRFAGSPDAIGGTMLLEGSPITVVGVLPDRFRSLMFGGQAGYRFLDDVEVWLPVRLGGMWAGARRFKNFYLVGRLRPGASVAGAQAEADTIFERLGALYPQDNAHQRVQIESLQAALVERRAPQLHLIMAAVGLLTLIACGNVANLLLARGTARRQELAVRASLGASRRRIARQLLAESVLLAGAGGAVGLAVAHPLRSMIVSLTALEEIGLREIPLSTPVLLFTVLVSIATGIVFGILPAARGSRLDLTQDLRPAGRSSMDHSHGRAQAGLVVAQVAVSCILLVGAGLLARSLLALARVDPGFDTKNLMAADISAPDAEAWGAARRIDLFGSVLEEIRLMPGVENASLISKVPLKDGGEAYPAWPRGALEEAQGAAAKVALSRIVVPGYFRTMGIPLLAGRDLAATDREGANPVAVLSRDAAATYFPGLDPIGRTIVLGLGGESPAEFEIVGVVGDVRSGWIGGDPERTVYRSLHQNPAELMRLVVRTSLPDEPILSAVRKAVWRLAPDVPVDPLVRLEDRVRGSLGSHSAIASLVASFGGLALILSAVGLHGVLAFWVGQHRRQIGVRLALGGTPSQVFGMVAGRGLRLALAGSAIGLAGAAASGRLLASQLYAVGPFDLAVYISIPLLLLATAALACWLPAWRAARLDPMTVLRME